MSNFLKTIFLNILVIVYILIWTIWIIMPYIYKKRKKLNINTLQKIDSFCNKKFPRFKNVFVDYLENVVCFDEAFEHKKHPQIYKNVLFLQLAAILMSTFYGSIQYKFNIIKIDLIPNWVWALFGVIWSLVGIVSSIWLFQYIIKFICNYKFDYNWRYLFFFKMFFKIIVLVLSLFLLLMNLFVCLDIVVYGLCGFGVISRIPGILGGNDSWWNVATDVADGVSKKFLESGKEN